MEFLKHWGWFRTLIGYGAVALIVYGIGYGTVALGIILFFLPTVSSL